MLVNCSNHPFSSWSMEQKNAAAVYGETVDFAFPSVPALAGSKEVQALAVSTAEAILQLHPDAVMCQGEMTCCFHIVSFLKERGVPVFAATSERAVEEHRDANGNLSKTVYFRFCRFRLY